MKDRGHVTPSQAGPKLSGEPNSELWLPACLWSSRSVLCDLRWTHCRPAPLVSVLGGKRTLRTAQVLAQQLSKRMVSKSALSSVALRPCCIADVAELICASVLQIPHEEFGTGSPVCSPGVRERRSLGDGSHNWRCHVPHTRGSNKLPFPRPASVRADHCPRPHLRPHL